jgi:hypothetical protein
MPGRAAVRVGICRELQEILPKGGLWVLTRDQPGAADPTGG